MNAELLAAVKALPHDEKVQLIEEVWSSLDDDLGCHLTAAQTTELQRRIRELEANPQATVAWDDVQKHSEATIQRVRDARK
jgi:putative addiction module component (TIGR02574 family)